MTWLEKKWKLHPSTLCIQHSRRQATGTNTGRLCLFLPRHRHRCRGNHTLNRPTCKHSLQLGGLRCARPRQRLPIAVDPGPAASRAPAHSPQCSLPASAGSQESCSVWVLQPLLLCLEGGKLRLRPSAQMCPGIRFTAGLALDSAMLFGGT